MTFLNSDDLGATAQDAFARLCSSAKIVSNKSADRDRTGWDFRIEYPTSELSNNIFLDKRPVPAPIMIQVKGISQGRDRILLNLRTLERFAKLSEPAVICILEFRDPDTVSDAYLIHLLGEPLSAILKRLTKISAEGKSLSGTETISFSKSKYWKEFEFSAEGIREAIEKHVISNETISEYSRKKNYQLEKLGYDENHLTGKMTLHAKNMEEYSDFTLGIKKVKVTDFQIFEERFGLKRQIEPFEFIEGELEITTTNRSDILAHFRADDAADPIVLDAKIALPAIVPLSVKKPRFLIKIPPLTIDVKPTGTFKLSLDDLEKIEATSDHWAAIFDIFNQVTNAGCKVSLATRDMKTFWSATITDAGKVDEKAVSENKFHYDTATYLHAILRKCGGQKLKFRFDDMLDAAEDIRSCYTSICESGGKISATFELNLREGLSQHSANLNGNYSNILRVGVRCIAYICQMTTSFEESGEIIKMTGTLDGTHVVRIISEEDYVGFIKDNSDQKTHPFLFSPTLGSKEALED